MLITQTDNTNPMISTLAALRSVVPKRRMERHEVLRLTELQAARLRSLLGEPYEPYFDETKLSRLPRIRVEWDERLPTSGMSVWDGQSWVLAVNSSEAPARQRFSLLHEFHHVIAHGVRDSLFWKHEGHEHSAEAERVADHFAACVLMPKLLVKRHWGRGPRKIGVMAQMFGVSLQAMTIRLEHLGLLEDRRGCNWARESGRSKRHLKGARANG